MIRINILCVSMLLIATLISCNKDEPTPIPKSDNTYKFVNTLSLDQKTVYLGLIKDLEVEEVNTDDYVQSQFSALFVNNGFIYNLESQSYKLYKYKQEKGALVREGNVLQLPANSGASFISFISDEKAYVSCTLLGKIIIINPNEMTITGEIDLQKYAVNYPTDVNPEPAGAIVRDNILFLGLAQDKAKFDINKGAYVLLIDTQADKPIKMINDMRATMSVPYEVSGCPFIDEKGDIYFYCNGMFGYNPMFKDGFIRIKKGEQDFDTEFFFSIKELNTPDVKGNRANYIHQMVYAENGKLYGNLYIPGNASTPPDYVNDKTDQPFEIDLYNKQINKLDFSSTPGYVSSVAKYNDKIIFGMATSEGLGYSVFDYKTQKAEPLKIKTKVPPYKILSIE